MHFCGCSGAKWPERKPTRQTHKKKQLGNTRRRRTAQIKRQKRVFFALRGGNKARGDVALKKVFLRPCFVRDRSHASVGGDCWIVTILVHAISPSTAWKRRTNADCESHPSKLDLTRERQHVNITNQSTSTTYRHVQGVQTTVPKSGPRSRFPPAAKTFCQ